MNRNEVVRYCRQKSAPAGSNLYYCLLFTPQQIQNRLFALHALQKELDDILLECSDPGVARMKLAWWLDELERMKNHQPRHPVSTLVSDLFADKLPRMNLHVLVSHCENQINLSQPENYHDLLNFLMQGPGLLWKLTCDVSGHVSAETPDLISRMGSLFGYFQVLQNLPMHMQLQRNYIPRDEWLRLDDSTGLYDQQITRLQSELETLIKQLPPVDRKPQVPALVMANILLMTCQEIRRTGFHLDRERVTLTPLRKTWIAWSTARRIN